MTYLWNFGDGSTSTARNPIHGYDTPEAVLVTLLVTDDEGATHTATTTIVIFPTIRPVADFSHEPEGGTIHDTLTFFDESRDEDGSILAWEWDFGDGETSRRKDPTHVFEDKGTHRVTLTVEDGHGHPVSHHREPPPHRGVHGLHYHGPSRRRGAFHRRLHGPRGPQARVLLGLRGRKHIRCLQPEAQL